MSSKSNWRAQSDKPNIMENKFIIEYVVLVRLHSSFMHRIVGSQEEEKTVEFYCLWSLRLILYLNVFSWVLCEFRMFKIEMTKVWLGHGQHTFNPFLVQLGTRFVFCGLREKLEYSMENDLPIDIVVWRVADGQSLRMKGRWMSKSSRQNEFRTLAVSRLCL